MRFSDAFNKFRAIIMSRPPIAGLEISHGSLKLLIVRDSTSVTQASLQIPPGIIDQGKIVDRNNFVAALQNLHLQIAPLSKTIDVVLVIPSQLAYTQNFSVPVVEKKQLEETISLNLQMISPTKAEETYSDWQEIKENPDAAHLDLLGAFANSAIMDEYSSSLAEAGFNPVSIEFPGLSLSRLIKQRWQNLSANTHYLLIYINTEGLLMLIIKNGNLSFNHFTPWGDVVPLDKQIEITFDTIRTFFMQELQRVVNYYFGRSNKPLSKAILISPLFNYEIASIAQEQFSLEVSNLTLAELPNLQPGWFVALGAALRGLLPQSRDTEISLTETNTQIEYYQNRVLTFVSLWRNIIVTTLIFMFTTFIVMDALFAHQEKTIQTQTANNGGQAVSPEVTALSEKAATFNQLLTLIEKTSARETTWSPFLKKLVSLTGADIKLERIFSDRSNLSTLITARATNELAAINFKNRLSKEPNITDVSLPLSNIKTEPDTSVTFTLTFKIKSLSGF